MSTLIDVPASSCIANVALSLMRVVARTTSPFSLQTQSFKWSGEQWSINFNMPPIVSRAIASDWLAFALKLEGSYNYFLMGDPSAKTPRGTAAGSPKVAANNQTGNVLQVKDFTPSQAGALLKGDYFQLGTGVNSRLYMMTEDAASDGSGNANLQFVPALRSSPALNDAIITTNPRGVFRLAENTYAWDVAPGPIYRLAFSAIEVINA